MSQAIPEEIEHLDFETEIKDDEEKEEYSPGNHHLHPTLPDYTWCGKKVTNGYHYIRSSGKKTVDKYKCEQCRRLTEVYDYWAMHNKHYGSTCGAKDGVIFHNCRS